MILPVVAAWNCSTLATDSELSVVADAIQKQVSNDLAPSWNIDATVIAVPKVDQPPVGAWVIRICDNCTEDGALGYHMDSGTPSGVVGVQDCKKDGVTWSSCLSHEVIETVCDSTASLAVESNGKVFALEVCDAVESCVYAIDSVEVSNFVLQSWFRRGSSPPYDHMGVLSAPFSVAKGGYLMSATMGGWEQFTDPNVRAFRRTISPGSRRARRMWR